MVGLGLLAATVGVVAWRQQKRSAGKALSVALMAGAALLATHGSDALMTSVRAAAPYAFSSASGGTVGDSNITNASPAPMLTVTNTSGGTVRITSNANTAETGTCTVGAELAAGASCTTQAVCPAAPVSPQVQVTADPALICDYSSIGTNVPVTNPDNSPGILPYYAMILDPAASAWYTPSTVSISSTITMAPSGATAIYDSNGLATNSNDLIIVTLTATAPTGYTFASTGTSTYSKVLPVTAACPKYTTGGGGTGN